MQNLIVFRDWSQISAKVDSICLVTLIMGDFGKAGEHICYWSVWTQKHNENAAAIEEKHAHSVGQVTYRPMKGLTKAQERCVLAAQKHRIVTALQRRGENGDIYDL